MITIDGSTGEGGGQILRTSLALSLVTGRAFKITKIRAGRKRPGLLRQHLTAVEAARAVSKARVTGAELGSCELTFEPGPVRPGRYHFAVGTAGSATLVLQAVLPALVTAGGTTTLTLEGGTHNPFAPPFDFLERTFLPVLNRMGPRVTAALERPGFYPAGGGRFSVRVEPAEVLKRVDVMERGEILEQGAVAIVSQLARAIGQRELAVLETRLDWDGKGSRVEEVADPRGPGNVLLAVVRAEHVTEVITGFGERGVTAERVADSVVKPVREYLAAGVPVGRCLADQLMVPMALAGGGAYMTLPPTRHTTTNAEVVRAFMDVEVHLEKVDRLRWHVKIEAR